MRVSLAGVERRGRALDLRDADVESGAVVDAIRDPEDECVRCQPPRRVHERVGVLHRRVSVSLRAAVAAAARSRGAGTRHDDDLRACRTALADLDAPDVDLEGARERVSTTAADVERLRERVARASGRVEARREDGDAESAEAALGEATRELAAAETEHHAARESLERARRRAREARDARERRLEVEDRLANLRRDARGALAERWSARFERAVDALPFRGDPAPPSEFDGPAWTAGCAAARLAAPGAPLVVADDLFANATRASAALGAPVVLVEV
ncbi:DUF7856 family protein [Halobacterium jilantaiense]|uniref:Uncharacterized protein n=1 Tax=Halobacterium jilantaiense TaxID=355548 RepID=A0A1I0PXX7_9EURY|nr:hypothetical protein [Halobacterium jilantaiense]SEW19353.1 hypothetical protein SAMN04487945_2075 [Halobacterium jilantaiense]